MSGVQSVLLICQCLRLTWTVTQIRLEVKPACICELTAGGVARCMLVSADFKNVSIVAHYIKERTKNAQFVIISLRNNMFELADRLVGIYKTNNATKSVAINPG